ncbi:MAG: hypothetical protein OHK0022_59770 [Roseiflexaceae bacterium]
MAALPAGRVALFDEPHAAAVDQIETGQRISGPIRFALQVDDLDAALERLAALGTTMVHPPIVTPWGHPQDSSQHHSQPMQLSLVNTVIFVGGLSIAIIGVAGFPTESQPSYHADGYYGAFFTGLCFALVGLSELCRPVLPSAPRFILWAAGACIPPAMWFAVRFLIARLLSGHL